MLGLRIRNYVLCVVLSAGLAVNCTLPAMGDVTLGPASLVSSIEVELGDGQQELTIEINNEALSVAKVRLPMALEQTATGETLSAVWRFEPSETNQVTPQGMLSLSAGQAGTLLLSVMMDTPGTFEGEIQVISAGQTQIRHLRLTRQAPQQLDVRPVAGEVSGSGESTRIQITARNRGTAAAVVSGGDIISGDPAVTQLTATWQSASGGEPGEPIRIGPGETADITISASLGLAGHYIAVMRVEDEKGERVADLKIPFDFGLGPLPDTSLTMPAKSQLTLPFLGSLVDLESATIPLTLRNGQAAPVVPGTLTLAPVFRSDATGAVVAVPSPDPIGIDNPCQNNTLASGETCGVFLRVPQGLSPGVWTLDATMTGAHGGSSNAKSELSVRRSAIWAFLAIILGSFVGTVIHAWRSVGRPALMLRAQLSDVAEAAALLKPAAAPIGPAGQTLEFDARRRIRAQIYDAAEVTSAEDLRARLAFLQGAKQLNEKVAGLDAPHRRVIMVLLERFSDAIESNAAGEEQVAAAQDFGVALNRLPGIMQATHELAEQARLARRAATMLGGTDLQAVEAAESAVVAAMSPAESATEIAENRKAVGEAAVALGAASPAIATGLIVRIETRLGVLEQAIQALTEPVLKQSCFGTLGKLKPRLVEFGNAAPDLATAAVLADDVRTLGRDVGVPETEGVGDVLPFDMTSATTETTSDGGIDVKPEWFLPGEASSSDSVRQRLRHIDLWTNVAAALILGLAGVAAVWTDAPTWGSLSDFIAAVTGGAVARLVLPTFGPVG